MEIRESSTIIESCVGNKTLVKEESAWRKKKEWFITHRKQARGGKGKKLKGVKVGYGRLKVLEQRI